MFKKLYSHPFSKYYNILKANGFIFGGFTEATWDGVSGHKPDPNAFLFSLTNNENEPSKMKINPGKNVFYCDPSYGPTFGNGHDIHISSNANTSNGSYSNLGSSYQHHHHHQYNYQNGVRPNNRVRNRDHLNYSQSFFAGSSQFLLSEIEVYQKEISKIFDMNQWSISQTLAIVNINKQTLT